MDEKKVLTPEEKKAALQEFIDGAKKKGKLTSKELMDITEMLELDSDGMDKLYDTLENIGVELPLEEMIVDLHDDEVSSVELMGDEVLEDAVEDDEFDMDEDLSGIGEVDDYDF